MLVVQVPNADPGPPLQGVPRAEAAAEDPVGGGEAGDWEVEGPVKGAGPHGGREVQPGGTWLPILDGCGKTGAGRDGGRRGERSVAAKGAAVAGGARSGGGGGGHRGDTTVPPHAGLQGVRRDGVGSARRSPFLCSHLCLSRSLLFLLSLASYASHLLGTGLGGGQKEACNEPPLHRQQTRHGLYISSPRSHRSHACNE